MGRGKGGEGREERGEEGVRGGGGGGKRRKRSSSFPKKVLHLGNAELNSIKQIFSYHLS